MATEPLTPKQIGTIISAYTGVLLTDMAALQTYIEKILGRPVWTHELASKVLSEEIREKSREDFMRVAKWCDSETPIEGTT